MEVRQTVSREVARSVIMSPYTTYYTLHSLYRRLVCDGEATVPQPSLSTTILLNCDTRYAGPGPGDAEVVWRLSLNGCWNLRSRWELESINIIKPNKIFIFHVLKVLVNLYSVNKHLIWQMARQVLVRVRRDS